MRLFVGIEVPEPQKRSIEKAIQELRKALPAARWVPRENWHVTLKFLGEVPDERVAELTEIGVASARRSAALATNLTDIGSFPSRTRTRVLWVGLDDPKDEMTRLSARLEKKLGKAGFRQESRKLHLHLTLARFRVPERIADVIESSGPYDLDRASFEVSEVVLFRSRLSRAGASYEAIERWRLGK